MIQYFLWIKFALTTIKLQVTYNASKNSGELIFSGYLIINYLINTTLLNFVMNKIRLNYDKTTSNTQCKQKKRRINFSGCSSKSSADLHNLHHRGSSGVVILIIRGERKWSSVPRVTHLHKGKDDGDDVQFLLELAHPWPHPRLLFITVDSIFIVGISLKVWVRCEGRCRVRRCPALST